MLYSHDDDVIVAQCTPTGPGAIALIRISGIQAVSVADAFCLLASGKKIADCASHTVHFARIINGAGQIIDQVMVTLMRAPKTFTGQDTVEITSHNNQFILEEILARAIAAGARMAQSGEFTRRAVLNEKMDLLQAEALNDLIHANTQQSARQALSQLEGSFSSWIASIERELLRAHALCQASFEFIDEEMTFDQPIKESLTTIVHILATIKRTFTPQQHIRQGIRIALIGSVNAGKSSLFNMLIGAQRAIVSPQAGTTRDTIEAGLYRNGAYWTLIDTAGLRHTNDAIEQEGIKRSHMQAESADIVLLVVDGSRLLNPVELAEYQLLYERYNTKSLLVFTKSDLPQISYDLTFPHQSSLRVSSVTLESLGQLEKIVNERIEQIIAQAASPYLVNQRQYHLLLGLEQQLHAIQEQLGDTIAYELLSYHLNDAFALLGEISGKSASEKAMDAIFREFCVGK
ncbi:tRNA uridine-5-carboxymethylaminomethyl(34) synthesis GTPase MnmE [Candidatus Dependentiae bacterium]|nr:tRNA uridine-5-carboxymethylaminomethyl(34) synthesis GTPase MnmE [Candidatus Dependentiae bacterium]MCC7415333.1 tRNA uridine-5-carboxymethylaminomethyl(34) synthesis GTPase MnmE [Campylobacterota bacterium]